MLCAKRRMMVRRSCRSAIGAATTKCGAGMHRRLDRSTYHPDTKRNPLDLIACEYGPTAPGALSVLMISLDVAKVRAA